MREQDDSHRRIVWRIDDVVRYLVMTSLLVVVKAAEQQSSTAGHLRAEWYQNGYSECSVSCGTGEEMSAVYCRDVLSKIRLLDRMCSDLRRPPNTVRTCHRQSCHPVWITGEWSSCSRPCGGGYSTRTSYCVEELKDGSFQRTLDRLCPTPREETNKTCNDFDCPKWFAGEWSPCSRTCGSGYQQRAVVCRQGADLKDCEELDRPITRRLCHNDISCTEEKGNNDHDNEDNFPFYDDLRIEDNNKNNKNNANNNNKNNGNNNQKFPKDYDLYGRGFEVAEHGDRRENNLANLNKLRPKSTIIKTSKSSTPRNDDDISSSGEVVDSTVSLVDENEGSGEVRVDYTTAKLKTTGKETTMSSVTITRWRSIIYGDCSVSCGGGMQLRHVQCVRVSPDGLLSPATSPDACTEPRPASTVACNPQPCPPTWTTGEWSKCSVSCNGTQTRHVRCQLSISKWSSTIVPDSFCLEQSQTPPDSVRSCQPSNCSTSSSINITVPRQQNISASFIQLTPKDKIYVQARNSSALLIEGTTVFVRCQTTLHLNMNTKDAAIQWKKDGLSISPLSRAKMLETGALRIRDSRLKDGGYYECIQRGSRNGIRMEFRTARQAAHLAEIRLAFISNTSKMDYSREGISGRVGSLNGKWDDKKIISVNKTDSQDAGQDGISDVVDVDRLLHNTPVSENVHYVSSDWSLCSGAFCGTEGFQTRNITCEMITTDFSFVLDDSYCEDGTSLAGVRPIDRRVCSLEPCPHWSTDTWGDCMSGESCQSPGYGLRHRKIECLSVNGSHLPASRCEQLFTRPAAVNESCFHQDCRVTWNPSAWSTCSVSCGGRGLKTRTVTCAWVANQRAANEQMCADLKERRPGPAKACFTSLSCPYNSGGCEDRSHHCPMLETGRSSWMCLYVPQRRRCCNSCQRFKKLASRRLKLF